MTQTIDKENIGVHSYWLSQFVGPPFLCSCCRYVLKKEDIKTLSKSIPAQSEHDSDGDNLLVS